MKQNIREKFTTCATYRWRSKLETIRTTKIIAIFLSNGERSVSDATVRSICRAAINPGQASSTPSTAVGFTSSRKLLFLHTVPFEPHEVSRRMAQIAREVEANAPQDPLLPRDAHGLVAPGEPDDNGELPTPLPLVMLIDIYR